MHFFFLDECFFLMQFVRDVRLHGKTCEMTYEMGERHIDSMVCTLVTKWDSFPVPGGGLPWSPKLWGVGAVPFRKNGSQEMGWKMEREIAAAGFPLNGVCFRTNVCRAMHRSLRVRLGMCTRPGQGWWEAARAPLGVLGVPPFSSGLSPGLHPWWPEIPAASCSACVIRAVPFLPPLSPL